MPQGGEDFVLCRPDWFLVGRIRRAENAFPAALVQSPICHAGPNDMARHANRDGLA